MTWRSLGPKDREDFIEWAVKKFRERMEIGAQTYNRDNDLFQGDPFEQAVGEAMDVPFYLWEIERQRHEEVGPADTVDAGPLAVGPRVLVQIGYRSLAISVEQARTLVEEISHVLAYVDNIRQRHKAS